MGVVHSGARNPNWRGGRSIASNGYVLLRVGAEHHLADVRGYAYEHRVVAEEMLGRRLEPSEIVHHLNRNKTDNREENLQVVESIAHHSVHHRTVDKGLRKPGEQNPEIMCACGCRENFFKFDRASRPRKYVSGHNLRGVR